MKKYAIEIASVIIGLCFVMLGYYSYIEYKKIDSVAPVVVQENINPKEGDGVAEYEIKTIVDIGSTSTFPFITKYRSESVKNTVNESIKELSVNCFWPEDTRESLIQDVLGTGLSNNGKQYTEKDLQKLSSDEIKKILADSQYLFAEVGVHDNYKNIYAKNDIFSFGYYYNTSCGGRPNAGTVGVTYDLKTGKEVTLDDIFQNYEKRESLEIGELFSGRSDVGVKEVFLDYYIKDYLQLSNGQDDNGCVEELDPNRGSTAFLYSTFYIDDTNIYIIPSLPQAIKVCSMDIKVPIKEVIKYAKPGSILSRIVE
jgi:hypothetical protein